MKTFKEELNQSLSIQELEERLEMDELKSLIGVINSPDDEKCELEYYDNNDEFQEDAAEVDSWLSITFL